MTRVAGAALLLLSIGPPPADAPRPVASDVVTRASAYVTRFVRSFTNVVAEEDYVQQLANGTRVATKADYLLVQLGPDKQYIPFRDVFDVNGAPVRDHENRLVDLFTHPAADILSQARAIHAASSRFNIGTQRTTNSPLLGVAFLQAALLPQFTFSLERPDKTGGEIADVLKFEEGGRPTIIRENGGDAPTYGRFWIAQSDGAILQSEVHIDTRNQTSSITVRFTRDDRFGVAVPAQMNERYTGSIRTEAIATYGRFRQFEITTVEEPVR